MRIALVPKLVRFVAFLARILMPSCERVSALRRVTGKKPDQRVHFSDPVAMSKSVKGKIEKKEKRKAEVRGRSPEKKVKSKHVKEDKRAEEPKVKKQQEKEKVAKEPMKETKEQKPSKKGGELKKNVQKEHAEKETGKKGNEAMQVDTKKTKEKKEKKREASKERTADRPSKSQRKEGGGKTGSDDKSDGVKTRVKDNGKAKVKYVPAVAEKIKHIFDDKELKKHKAEAKFTEILAEIKSSEGDSDNLDFDLDDFESSDDGQAESEHSEVSSDEADKGKENGDEEEAETSSENEPEEKDGDAKGPAIDDPQESDSGSESAEDSDEEGSDNEEEEEKEKEIAEPSPETHALVPVANSQAAASKEAIVVRNSSTNKREWDAYMRQIASKGSKLAGTVADHFQKDKVELFNIWLDCNKDWNSCKLEVERLSSSRTTAEKGWEAVQGKELRQKLSQEKFDQLVASRKASGLCFDDDDFPNDVDEMWFWMKAKQKYTQANITEEAMKLKAKAEVDKGLREALVDGESGILRAGVLPKVEGASSAGAKALLNSITAVSTAPKKKPGKDKNPEEMQPKTLKDEAGDKLGAMLQTAASARSQSIKLSTTEYGKDLSSTLLSFAESLEKDYKKLKSAIDGDEEKAMKKLMKVIRVKEEAGSKAQQAATAMLKPAAKKKAKKEEKEKAA